MNKWTIILLVSAENNLINESVKAIEEIYRAGHHKDVKFLIIFDGLEYGKFSKEFAKPSVYEVNHENGFFIDKPVYVDTSDNLSKTSTVTKFLKFIKKNYESANYGLIYKGHGASGQTDISSGVFIEKLVKIPESLIGKEDEIQMYLETKLKKEGVVDAFYEYKGFSVNNEDRRLVMAIIKTGATQANVLSYKNLADSIVAVFPEKISFVCLDCCWGQQIENAYTFAPVTDHFIASVDQAPALGMGYQELCSKINQRPNIRPEEIAQMIVAVYFYRNYDDYDSPNEDYRKMGVSFTYLSTQMLLKNGHGKSFEEKMKPFCDYLISNMAKFVKVIFMSRKKCKDYTYSNTEELEVKDIQYAVFNIDLAWFLSNLKYYNKEADIKLDYLINELQMAIEKDLIIGYLGSNYKKPILGGNTAYEGGNGLSILFPVNIKQAEAYDSLYYETDLSFYKNTNWLKFLSSYYKAKDDHSKSNYSFEVLSDYDLKSFSPSFLGFDESYNKGLAEKTVFMDNEYKKIMETSDELEPESTWGKIILKK